MDQKTNRAFQRYWRLLSDYVKPQRGIVALLAILLLAHIGLQLINPQIVRYFLDQAESGSGTERLLGAASLFITVALISQILRLMVTYLGENIAWTATNTLREDLALHCLRLDMSFHKRHKAGELIERVDGDVNQLANFFSQLVMRLGSNLLIIAGVLILLGWQDWRLGVSISGVAGLGMMALNWLNKRSIPRWNALREADAKLFGFLEEWLNGTEAIRSCGASSYIMLRLYHALRERWRRIMSAMHIQVLVSDLPLGVFALAYIVAHILGNYFFQSGQMTIGQIFLIFYYLDLLRGPLWEILRQVEDLQRATASINRVAELRQKQPTILDGPGVTFPHGPLGVAFDQVTFHYEDEPETNVLCDISFRLKPGTVLGLLGRTGSGKSTLTRLLFRFHDPSLGAVLLGNGDTQNAVDPDMIDIREAKLSQLRGTIGMVTQEVQLFHATVRQNLTLFDDTVPDQHTLQVIEEIGLDGWFAQLPYGLDTPLGAGRTDLSAGEAQLLAFGRVFLADPGLVILDEASSRLDPATERHIDIAVKRLLANRTGIIIAHRLSTVQEVDEIMILENGRIAEHGLRHALSTDPDSLFYQLMQTGMEEVMA